EARAAHALANLAVSPGRRSAVTDASALVIGGPECAPGSGSELRGHLPPAADYLRGRRLSGGASVAGKASPKGPVQWMLLNQPQHQTGPGGRSPEVFRPVGRPGR